TGRLRPTKTTDSEGRSIALSIFSWCFFICCRGIVKSCVLEAAHPWLQGRPSVIFRVFVVRYAHAPTYKFMFWPCAKRPLTRATTPPCRFRSWRATEYKISIVYDCILTA